MATAGPFSSQDPPKDPAQATDPPPHQNAERDAPPDQHAQASEQREAYEYWGYLFKPDKTGTDKLKSLLRGLKDVINEKYEPSDQPDLTPNQLAHFYRELHGNYDQLFLGTPNESIAFIYKSLGCLHSLQPMHHTHATAFTDPTVPALKTEGWIMWQTIQLLLGPEEHSGFLREAVQTWDIKDHETGDVLPKVLPRECFPLEPDKHMVAWYEGVSERLRREAEQEERQKEVEVEHEDPRRLRNRSPPPSRRNGGADMIQDDERSVDSRGPALAYFRNPLYRHMDGRPSIVRQNSKRPGASPRPSIADRGKDAASTFGHIVRNVGSPHLWDGRGGSRSGSRDRRRSYDERYHYPADPALSSAPYDHRLSPRDRPPPGDGRRRRPSQIDRPVSGVPGEDWDNTDPNAAYGPGRRASNGSRHHFHHRGPSDSRPAAAEPRDQPLRHIRSHDPTPNQEPGEDYFAGYDAPQQSRRNSNFDANPSMAPAAPRNSVGPSFEPSASPLFASHVARQPHPPPRFAQQPPTPSSPGDSYGPPGPAPSGADPGLRQDSRSNPSIRRAAEHDSRRYSSRSPDPASFRPRSRHQRSASRDRDRDRDRDRPPHARPHSRYDQSPPSPYDDRNRHRRPSYQRDSELPLPGNEYPDHPSPAASATSHGRGAGPGHRGRGSGSRDRDRDRESRNRDWEGERDQRDRDRERDRRSAHLSGSDVSGYYSGDDKQNRPKQTRFAETGVGGRRYPD